MKNLVKRYVAAMIRDAKTEEGLTEENFKELKQDISSFRFEVLGLLKGNKLPSLQSSTTSRDDDSLQEAEEGDDAEGHEKVTRRKLSLFDVTTMIHPRTTAQASKAHILSNGSALMAPESTKEKPKKVNFVPDVKKFGFFHKQAKNISAEQSANQIYSISEEVSRQQMEELHEESAELGEEELVVNCELNIHRPGDHGPTPTTHQGETSERKPEEAAPSASAKKDTRQDSELLTPKDLLDKGLQDFSRDASGKQETIVQDNYLTTRL